MQESPRETERERERNGNKERKEKKAWSREYHIFEVMFLSEAVALGLFCIMYEKIFSHLRLCNLPELHVFGGIQYPSLLQEAQTNLKKLLCVGGWGGG